MRPLPLALLIGLAAVTPAFSQARAPSRPRLPAAADTNSAAAYYQFGLARLRRNPSEAADALYWASRIDPASAEILYARHVASLLSEPDILDGWVIGDDRVLRSPQARAIDSLRARADLINPFLRPFLDAEMIEQWAENRVMRDRRDLSITAVQFAVREFLDDIEEPATRGWLLSARGLLPAALAMWAPSLRRDSTRIRMRLDRANVYVSLGRLDSARADIDVALVAARRADTLRIRHVYESKASLEYARGVLLARMRDFDAARSAFERALVENLGYYPAHIRLSQLALAARDTAGAVRELERAIDIRPDDYDARLMLGYIFARLGRFDEAVVHLDRAALAEPWSVTPVNLLAMIHESAGSAALALAAYQRLLQLCPRDDPARPVAEQRIAALSAAQGGSP